MPVYMEHQPEDIIHGRYKIIKYIGGGGFGETYLVEDTQFPGQVFVLKYLKPPSNRPEVLRTAERLFHEEANTLRRLGNSNQQIPKLYDFFQENQKFYLVQEYIDGQNLKEEIRIELFNEQRVIDILCQILKILDYLAQNKVIHRDIKPENLIRRRSDNKIFLIDFGAVKQISGITVNAQGETISTVAVGTRFYMPPEQSEGHPNYTSDIYALGITGFVLLTNRIPSRDHKDEIIWNGMLISPYLATILNKMVRSDWHERYQRAEDVLADLQPLTLLGKTLNQRYEIRKYLGGKGLIHTYLAADLSRPVQPFCLIKQLKLRTNNQQIYQEAQRRFDHAVERLGTLANYRQIPRLWNHFEKNQQLYLVYELIDGESLSQRIKVGNCLSEAEVIALLKDVLPILSFIHQQNIIHGDIKPSNLMKRQQDQKICLIDFGEFKQIVNLDLAINPGGTPGYMPAEQIQNRLKPCSDIYALGMTAIQALTGVSPDKLPIDNQGEIVWQNQAQVSGRLARILTKMVRFQCGNRYQSAQRVIEALESGIVVPPSLRSFFKWATFGIVSIGTVAIIHKIVQINESQKLYERGLEFQDQGKYEDAIASFDKALQIAPNFLEAKVNKGVAQGKLKNFTLQSEYCQQAVGIDPNLSIGWLCVGNAHHDLKEYKEAIQSFDTLANLTCDSQDKDDMKLCYDAWNAKGDSLLKQQNPEEALQQFEKVLQKDDKRSITWTNKGWALMQLNRCSEALDAFNNALNIRPGYKDAIYGKEKAEKCLPSGTTK